MNVVDVFAARKAAAIQDVEAMRDTHVQWRDHLRECRDCPHAAVAGDLAHHERCIEQYNRIHYVLNYSVAPVPPSAGSSTAPVQAESETEPRNQNPVEGP